MATKPNPISPIRSGATVEQLRHEIDECRTMVKVVEDMLRRYRRVYTRD